MQHALTILARPPARIIGAFAIIVLLWSAQTTPLAADPLPITCTGLTISLSSDKTRYIFTAAASGENGQITGYTFDFGDHQSYIFQFPRSTSQQNRYQASTVHTYLSAGAYTAKVHVDTKLNGKSGSTTSQACDSSVTIGPSVLANAGTNNTPVVFATATVIGVALHQTYLRARNRRYH